MQDEDAVAQFLLRFFDLRFLFLVVFHAQSAGHAQADGVVGEGDHFDAAFGGGPRHLQHRQLAVPPGGMHLQISADVFDLDQFGQFAGFGGLHFAAVFAQFGGIHGRPSVCVNFSSVAQVISPEPSVLVRECSESDSP